MSGIGLMISLIVAIIVIIVSISKSRVQGPDALSIWNLRQ